MTGSASRRAHPITQQLLEGTRIDYAWLTQRYKAICSNTKKRAKAENDICALKQKKFTAMYTHKFNLHLHYTTWKLPTLISECTQGLKNNISVAFLLSYAEFTDLNDLFNCDISLWNTINISDDTLTSPINPTPWISQQPKNTQHPPIRQDDASRTILLIQEPSTHITRIPSKNEDQGKRKNYGKACIAQLASMTMDSAKITELKAQLLKWELESGKRTNGPNRAKQSKMEMLEIQWCFPPRKSGGYWSRCKQILDRKFMWSPLLHCSTYICTPPPTISWHIPCYDCYR